MNYKYLEPGAKKVVDKCKKEDIALITHVGGFVTNEEALILRDLLMYAYDQGVVVTFIPSSVPKK